MIALGCDHAGLGLKLEVIKYLEDNKIEYKDFGTYSDKSVDYPDFAEKVCLAITGGTCETGLLFCGTGIGVSIAANKFHGIRAAACSENYSVKYTRLHNDANVLCLGGRVIGPGLAVELVDIFLNTPFSNGENHLRRLNKIKQIENR